MNLKLLSRHLSVNTQLLKQDDLTERTFKIRLRLHTQRAAVDGLLCGAANTQKLQL